MGHYVSEEGILLFVYHMTISCEEWVKLLALVTELHQLQSLLFRMPFHHASSNKRAPQLVLAAGWLHRRRRKLLKSICCTSEQQRDELLETCQKKLTQYR